VLSNRQRLDRAIEKLNDLTGKPNTERAGP
jgi:hypothetical protein